MVNKFSNLKIDKQLVFSIIIISLFIVSSGVALNQNFASNQQITNSLNDQVNSALINALTKNSASSSEQSATIDTGTMRNVIFHYTSQNEKTAILDYVAKNGILVSSLQYLPFILAKIPLSKYNYLSSMSSNIYLDKVFQAFPKNIMKDAVKADIVNPNYTAPINQVNGESLIQQGFSGNGIKIAIIDTGIDATHPDLQGKVLYNTSYVTKANGYSQTEDSTDQNGHGTHVAALAVGTGVASNGKYIGVAPNASLFNLKVGSFLGSATDSGIIEAVNEAIKLHANIISMSLGSSGSYPDDPISIAYDIAVNKYGIIATISAGNSGPGIGTVATPASARSVITVGAAYWENDTATFFSSRGPTSDYRYDPDVLAPGWQEISALAKNSLTDFAQKYYTPSAVIPGNGGNYIAFSGTSMAAPVTAGSVALLLNKYPDLSPQALRAALMSTATDTNQPEYVQGAGFINLAKADTLLNSTYKQGSNKADVVSLLPQRSIYPNSPHLYPGDQLNVNLQFVAGDQFPIGLSFSGNSTSLISYNKSVTSLFHEPSGGYYGELMLTFKAPLNPIPGIYTGSVQVSLGSHVYNLQVGPVQVTIPTNRIAWNVWYNTDGQDTPTGNYANLSSHLEKQNIHMSVVNKPVDPSWLYQYKAVIFPDNELAISNTQVKMLQDYIKNGGKVILISSFYPYSEIANYNQLSSGYGITLGHTADLNITDLGLTEVTQLVNRSMTLNNFDTAQFGNNNNNLYWYGGSFMDVSGGASAIGSLTNGTAVIAGFGGNSTVKGQLFVFGSEFWFYNYYYGSRENSFSNEFFSYLLNETQPFVNIVNTQDEIPLGQPWNASIFIGQNSLFDQVSNATISLQQPNGTALNLTGTRPTGSVGENISVTPMDPGRYTLSVEYKNQVANTSFLVYNNTINYNFTLNPSQQPTSVPVFLQDSGTTVVDQGTNLVFSFDTNQTLPKGTTASVEVTLVPEVLNQITGYTQLSNSLFSTKVQLYDSGNNHYQGSLTTNTSLSIGFYATELIISNAKSNFTGSLFNEFYLSAPDPKIDTAKSTVDGTAFGTYDVTKSPPKILTIHTSQTLNISIKAQTLTGQGSAFVLFVPFYPFLESQDVIGYWQLNQTSTGLFQGNIVLPATTSVQTSNGRTLNFGNNLITALLVILRDNQGNIDLYTIVTTYGTNTFSPDNLMMILFFVVIPALIVTGYYLKSRNKRKNDSYNYNFRSYQYNNQQQNPYQGFPPPYQQNQSFQPQDEIKFCPYCGSSLTPGSNFCMECGKKIK